ncbi:hypothetical protein Moror_4195 [Moniliophthora roreri MCA 2997]|uniref:Uncharacterized protein n=2 Tax=Moniliophthora roreri TaxID=221103 RepID=V2XCV1_MONRO|nr:hypothetical protein Moror_4195 [Moniliophthora roreri MCA 2997]
MSSQIFKRFNNDPKEVCKREGEDENNWVKRINPNALRLHPNSLAYFRGPATEDWLRRWRVNINRAFSREKQSLESRPELDLDLSDGEEDQLQEGFDDLLAEQSFTRTSKVSPPCSRPMSHTSRKSNAPLVRRSSTPAASSKAVHQNVSTPLFSPVGHPHSSPEQSNLDPNSDDDRQISSFIDSLKPKLREFSSGGNERLNAKIAKKDRQILRLEGDNVALEATNRKLRDQFQKASKDSEDLKIKVQEKRAVLQTMKQERNEAQAEVAQLKRQIDDTSAENRKLRAEIRRREKMDARKVEALQAYTSQLFQGKASGSTTSSNGTSPVKRRKLE